MVDYNSTGGYKMEKQMLTMCELKVMCVVWDEETAPDLATIIKKVNKRFGQDWKPQTVSTFLARCVQKKYVTWEKEGRYAYYTPLVSKEEYFKSLMKEYCEIFGISDISTIVNL